MISINIDIKQLDKDSTVEEQAAKSIETAAWIVSNFLSNIRKVYIENSFRHKEAVMQYKNIFEQLKTQAEEFGVDVSIYNHIEGRSYIYKRGILQ